MTTVDGISEDVFRLSVFESHGGFHFNQFLVRDEQPLLFHLGMNGMFEEIRKGVAKVLEPASLRRLAFSHFEADECGSLNRWLELAPQAEPACTVLASDLSVSDIAARPPRALQDGDVIDTGRHRLRCLFTPHVPHNWDALKNMDGTLYDHSTPWTTETPKVLARLAELQPQTLAIMHGACYRGDGGKALTELSGVMQEAFA